MDYKLKIVSFDKLKPAKETRSKKTALYVLNLCFIDGSAFHYHACRKESIIIITSMYKINRLIKDKKQVAGAKLESKDEIIKAELPD
jgi:hypothetical protein